MADEIEIRPFQHADETFEIGFHQRISFVLAFGWLQFSGGHVEPVDEMERTADGVKVITAENVFDHTFSLREEIHFKPGADGNAAFVFVPQTGDGVHVHGDFSDVHGMFHAGAVGNEVIEETNFRQSFADSASDIVFHAAVRMVAKRGVDVIINHDLFVIL